MPPGHNSELVLPYRRRAVPVGNGLALGVKMGPYWCCQALQMTPVLASDGLVCNVSQFQK